MKFWQALAMLDMAELPVLASHAEELGFEGVTLSEHLITFSEQYEQYLYSNNSMIRWYPETHWADPWIQVAALSQQTEHLKFLTSVYVLPMHDPFSVAKTLSTLENICPERLLLGIGVGWQKSEFDLVGQDFHNRGRRTDEMLDVMKQLWTGEPVAFEGEFFQFPSLQMSPGLKGRLPVLVGGISEAALRRAARNDGWVGAQHEIDEALSIIDRLGRYRRELGKSMDDFEIALGLYTPSEENILACEEAGVSILYREAFCDENGMASKMTLKEKMLDMEEFAERYLG